MAGSTISQTVRSVFLVFCWLIVSRLVIRDDRLRHVSQLLSEQITGYILSDQHRGQVELRVRVVKFFLGLNFIEFIFAVFLTRLKRPITSNLGSLPRSVIMRGYLSLVTCFSLVLISWLAFIWAVVQSFKPNQPPRT